jgi:hypothetical protein
VVARGMKISQNVISIKMPCATVVRLLGLFIFTVRFVFKYQVSQYLEQNISVPFLPYNQTSETLCLHLRTEDETLRSLVGRTALLCFKQVASRTGACAVHHDTTAPPTPRTTRPLYHG